MKVKACPVHGADCTTPVPLCTKSVHPGLDAPFSGIRRS